MKLSFIEAGEIVTTHGVRGEVKVLCWLDSPELLCEYKRCRIRGKEYGMDSVRVQKNCNLVKLKGVDTMESAQALRGATLELFREDIDSQLIFAAELLWQAGLITILPGDRLDAGTEAGLREKMHGRALLDLREGGPAEDRSLYENMVNYSFY